MTVNEIHLPVEIEQLLKANLFEIEDSTDDQLLSKYLFYMPEVARIYGLLLADLKDSKRKLFRGQRHIESIILLGTVNAIDSQKYKNEQLRSAMVTNDPTYMKLQLEIDAIEYEIDKTQEFVWKFKNLMQSLSDISKLRISGRKF